MPELYTLHRLSLAAAGQPLFAVLAEHVAGLSRRQAREAVSAGLVRVAGEVVREPKSPLPDAQVAVELDLRHGIKRIRQAQRFAGAEVAATVRPFTILHEDHELVVVDKAAGVLSAPNAKDPDAERGHVPELLRGYWRKQGRRAAFIGTLHRLDRDTSGCLVFALTREAQRLCAAQFAGGAAGRIYRCVVAGQPSRDEMTIEARLGRHHASGKRGVVDEEEPGKDAVTHLRVLRRFALGAEVEVRLETGRTHQIRVHLASIACPVWGDRVYARRSARLGGDGAPKPTRLMLHAWKLELDHPADGRRLTVEAPLPEEYRTFVEALAQATRPPRDDARRDRPARPPRDDARADRPARPPRDGSRERDRAASRDDERAQPDAARRDRGDRRGRAGRPPRARP